MSEWRDSEGYVVRDGPNGSVQMADAKYVNALAQRLRELEAELSRYRNHGWVPDPLVDHDAPVCEICGEGMAAHKDEALLTMKYFHEIEQAKTAEARVARYEQALEKAHLQFHGHAHSTNFTEDGKWIEFKDCTLWVCTQNRKQLAALAADREPAS